MFYKLKYKKWCALLCFLEASFAANMAESIKKFSALHTYRLKFLPMLLCKIALAQPDYMECFCEYFFATDLNFSPWFRSVLWLDHYNSWKLLDLNHCTVALVLCLGLSFWEVHLCTSLKSVLVSNTFFFTRIVLYFFRPSSKLLWPASLSPTA